MPWWINGLKVFRHAW